MWIQGLDTCMQPNPILKPKIEFDTLKKWVLGIGYGHGTQKNCVLGIECEYWTTIAMIQLLGFKYNFGFGYWV